MAVHFRTRVRRTSLRCRTAGAGDCGGMDQTRADGVLMMVAAAGVSSLPFGLLGYVRVLFCLHSRRPHTLRTDNRLEATNPASSCHR